MGPSSGHRHYAHLQEPGDQHPIDVAKFFQQRFEDRRIRPGWMDIEGRLGPRPLDRPFVEEKGASLYLGPHTVLHAETERFEAPSRPFRPEPLTMLPGRRESTRRVQTR